MSNIQPYDDIFQTIYNWAKQDKIFHYGKYSGIFSVGNTITGSVSTATGTITYVDKNHIRYTKTSTPNFQKNDVVTNGLGAMCIARNINEFHGDVSDRIYFQEAPEELLTSVLPYSIFQFFGEVPDDYYAGKISRIDIRWSLFTGGSSSLSLFNILSDFQTLFDFPELVFTKWNFVSFLRQRTFPVIRDVNKIWSCLVDYNLVVKQN